MSLGNRKKIAKKIFNQRYLPYQIRSELFDIYFGLKPTARIILDYGNFIEKLVKFLIKLKLYISVSRGFVLNNNSQGYADWFSKNKKSKKMVCFYIAKKKNLAINCRTFDEKGDDKRFGKVLGYPKCCIIRVIRDGQPPTILQSFKKYLINKNNFNPYLWPPSMTRDSFLISHFPCSSTCKKSIKMSEEKWRLLKILCSEKTQNHYKLNLNMYYYKKKNKILVTNKKKSNVIKPLFLL